MSFMDVFKWFLHSRDHVPRFYFSYAFQRLSRLRDGKTERYYRIEEEEEDIKR